MSSSVCKDVARKNSDGWNFRGSFHWFWAYLYAFLGFYNRNAFILFISFSPDTPKYAHADMYVQILHTYKHVSLPAYTLQSSACLRLH